MVTLERCGMFIRSASSLRSSRLPRLSLLTAAALTSLAQSSLRAFPLRLTVLTSLMSSSCGDERGEEARREWARSRSQNMYSRAATKRDEESTLLVSETPPHLLDQLLKALPAHVAAGLVQIHKVEGAPRRKVVVDVLVILLHPTVELPKLVSKAFVHLLEPPLLHVRIAPAQEATGVSPMI